jgi:hypothetical protein
MPAATTSRIRRARRPENIDFNAVFSNAPETDREFRALTAFSSRSCDNKPVRLLHAVDACRDCNVEIAAYLLLRHWGREN